MATKIKASNLGSSATTAITNIVTENSVDSALVNGLIDSSFAHSKTSDDLSEGSTHLYYTTSRGDSDTGDYIAGNRTYGNITTTGYIAGPATFTIDPAAVGDNTGTLVVAGNLQVDGTTTTINSTTMEVDDINITLASGAANAAAANGAGITVDGASATITYGSTSDSWSFNKNVDVTGTVTADGLTVDGTATINGAAGIPLTLNATGNTNLQFNEGGALRWYIRNLTGSNDFNFYGNGASRLNIGSGGDISFYNPSGTAKFFWDASAESLGIGTAPDTTPSTKLHIREDDAVDYKSRAVIQGNDQRLVAGSHWQFGVAAYSYLQATNDAETVPNSLLLNPDGGNVGIGTTSPSQPLHVVGGAVQFQNTQSTYLQINTGDTHLYTAGSHPLRFGTNSIERLNIQSNGDVNIGGAADAGNALRYFDIYNTNTGATAGSIIRLITSNAAGSGVTTGELIKYKSGLLALVNSEPSATANTAFWVAGAERMRIDSSGNVCIGNTAANVVSNTSNQPGGGYVVSDTHWEFATASNRSAVEIGKNNANDGQLVTFRKQGTTVGSVSVTSSGTTYNTTSDIRLKIDIEPIADATDKVIAMNAVTHKWKDNPESDAVHGFIAQEMKEIIPEAVSGDENSDEMMSMDYGRITPIIVAALQDALKEIDMLKNRIAELEAK